MDKRIGKLIIITGFPAAGKDTLMNLFLQKRPEYARIITYTSRPIRKKERNGVDYHFVSHAGFKKMIKDKLFFEHVLHGSHYKGTSKEAFAPILKGKKIVWRIDLSRAAILENTFRKSFEHKVASNLINRTTKILVKTTNPHVALARYQARDPEDHDEGEYKKRLDFVTSIWLKHRHKFPHIIENKTGKQKEALKEILQIVRD